MKQKIKFWLIWIILFFMSTFFAFATTSTGINIILVTVMYSFPLFLFFFYKKPRKEDVLLYLIFICMFITAIFHPRLFRLSTLLYSLMFIFTFILYSRLIKELTPSLVHFEKMFKLCITLFFVVLIIQQVSFLAGIPIFNYRVGNLSTIKFNSLASEPSYLGRIVTLFMLSYITIREISYGQKYLFTKRFFSDKRIWIMYLYIMIFSGSSTSLVILFIFMFNLFSKRQLLTAGISVVVILVLFTYLDFIPLGRILKIATAFFTLNVDTVMEADASGGLRLAPTMLYLEKIDLATVNAWIGYGIDSTSIFLQENFAAFPKDSRGMIGFFPAYMRDYGLIPMFMLFAYMYRYIVALPKLYNSLIIFIVLLDAPFNTQMFWLMMLLMYTNFYIKQKYSFCKDYKSIRPTKKKFIFHRAPTLP